MPIEREHDHALQRRSYLGASHVDRGGRATAAQHVRSQESDRRWLGAEANAVTFALARERRDPIAPPAQQVPGGAICIRDARCLTTEVRKTPTPVPSVGGSVAPAALGERDSLGCERCCFRRAAGIGVRVEFHPFIAVPDDLGSRTSAAVAQWMRAPGYDPGGREFDSLRRLDTHARLSSSVSRL